LLESHAPLQLRRLRVLGIFLEDPIETLHHSNNKQNRSFCSLKNFAKLEEHKIKINESAHSSEVKDLITRVKSSSTRAFRDHIQISRSAKHYKNVKSEKRKEFLADLYNNKYHNIINSLNCLYFAHAYLEEDDIASIMNCQLNN